MPVTGIERVKANYRMKVKQISIQKSEAAVYAILSHGSAAAALMTPVDTSNLINSLYAPQITYEGNWRVTGHVGYTAMYAHYVHECPGTLKGEKRPGKGDRGLYWDPAGEPKFLEKGFDSIRPSIPAIIKAIYRV